MKTPPGNRLRYTKRLIMMLTKYIDTTGVVYRCNSGIVSIHCTDTTPIQNMNCIDTIVSELYRRNSKWRKKSNYVL